MKVLVVEDNIVQSSGIVQLLTVVGYEAYHAATVEEAKEALVKGRYDAVVVDIVLPGATGISLVSWMRGNPDFDSTSIVVTTGLPLQDLAYLRQVPKLKLLQKPYHTTELCCAISELVVAQR